MAATNSQQPADSADRLVALTEASRRLGLEVSWLRRLAARGDFPAHRVGSTWVIASRDLDAYLADRQRRGGEHTQSTRPATTAPVHTALPPTTSAPDWMVPPASSISSPILIGRQRELARLVEAATSPPSVTLIEGEAGVGKSRLIAEMASRAQHTGTLILIGRCHLVREPLLLGPMLDALRATGPRLATAHLDPVAGALSPLLPELAGLLPPRPPSLGDPLAQRHLMFRAVATLLGSVGPVACVLEDLQWADDITLDLLRYLTGQMPRSLAVIVSYQREQLEPRSPVLMLTGRPFPGVSASTIHVEPLSTTEVGELVAAILRTQPVPDAVSADLHASTGGIPFAVEEVVRVMRERHPTIALSGRLARGTIADLPVPSPVRALTLQRASMLRHDARRIVEAAAVVGTPAPIETLRAIAGLSADRATRALAEALGVAMLVETAPRRYGFRHALAAQAMYDGIAAPERQRLHLKAAAALEHEDPRPVALLARHYEYGERPQEWVACAESAADMAASRLDDWAAARFLVAALGAPGIGVTTRARMTLKLAVSALSANVAQTQTVALIQRVLDEPGVKATVRGQLRANLGLLLAELGDATAGYREQAHSVAELRRRPDLAALVMGNLALPGSPEGHEREHRRWQRQAVINAERSRSPWIEFVVATVAVAMSVWFGDVDAWDAVAALPWSSESAPYQRQLLWLASQLAGASCYLGHDERARSLLADAERLAAETIWDRFRPLRETCALLLRWSSADWSGLAAAAADHAEAMRTELPFMAAVADMVIGNLQLAKGEFTLAEATLTRACDASLAGGLAPVMSEASAGLTRVRLALGDLAGAVEYAQRALAVVERKGTWPWAAAVAPEAVDALLRCGRADEASDLTARFAKGVRGRDATAAIAALSWCRGHLAEHAGRRGAAVQAYARAEIAYADVPRPYSTARLRARRGAVLLDCGDPAGADLLVAALARFDTLGAVHDADATRQVLRGHDVVVGRRRTGRRGYGSELSPQEQRVADLAAQGHQDTEIAQRLFLSVRTVEHHMENVRRKLGIRTRAALITRWLRVGDDK